MSTLSYFLAARCRVFIFKLKDKGHGQGKTALLKVGFSQVEKKQNHAHGLVILHDAINLYSSLLWIITIALWLKAGWWKDLHKLNPALELTTIETGLDFADAYSQDVDFFFFLFRLQKPIGRHFSWILTNSFEQNVIFL